VSETPFLDEPELVAAEAIRQKPRRGDLTQGPVAKTLLLFALPTLGANILQSLNVSTSAIYVGKFLGENAFAAAGIATMVMQLIFSTIFGLAVAATIMIGQAMGRRDLEEVRRTIGATTGTFILAGLGFAMLGHLAIPTFLRLLATPPAAFEYARTFLEVVFFGLPILFLNLLMQSALRGVGDAVTPFWSNVLNLGLSIVVNPVLILGLGPFPAMGLAGAALSGVCANLICLIFMVFRIYQRNLPIALRGSELHLLRPDWEHLRPVLTIGLPMGLSMIIMTMSAVVMMALINREGVETIAAFNATNQILNYIQMPAFAIGGAVSAMAAQNIGAGRWDRINRLAVSGVSFATLLTAFLLLILLTTSEHLLGIFLPSGSPAIAIGNHISWLIGWTFIPMGISMVMTTIVRANGAAIPPLLILIFSVIVVRMALGFALYPTFRADAIWWAYMASSTCSALMAIAYYRYGSWRKGSPLASRRSEPAPAE